MTVVTGPGDSSMIHISPTVETVIGARMNAVGIVYGPVEEDRKLRTRNAMSASFIGVLALFPELSQLALSKLGCLTSTLLQPHDSVMYLLDHDIVPMNI
jgi:hypothetical protein